ncbi:hypothetical protein BT63DRAFT_432328 [Microthyrium microscopicum]|uniref:Histone-lysine N-methyltransferase, H3 lysine-4 specific n=1 Tax=Microthyrium microscopicum TaxID=703497 RepID=A0A6A6UI87_9PEZI|nr:hypothetical protein BT63DRAFT_432328 [Microthyrium microscopicum]
MSSFSGNQPPTLTPITNSESSPPDNMNSPSKKRSYDQIAGNGIKSPNSAAASRDLNSTQTHTPPEFPRQARPAPGEISCTKMIYDPDAPGGDRKKPAQYTRITIGSKYDLPTTDPRLLFPDYPHSFFKNIAKPSKAQMRPVPYTLKPYSWDSKHSVGRGPAEQVVVHGFDPLLISEHKIRAMMSQYGTVTEIKNITDPETGSFLGICVVGYGDRNGLKKSKTAADSARRAEKEGNGQRIDQWHVKVERDAEGLRSKRYAAEKVRRRKAELQKLLDEQTPKTAVPTLLLTSKLSVDIEGPPANAPKGPSMKPAHFAAPFAAPFAPPAHRVPATTRPAAHVLVEQDPILPKIKRQPYIFIAKCYVPVLGTTLAHLEKRLKAYSWREIRCDGTGYFILFDESRAGQYEAERCHTACNMHLLFTYTMNMALEKYGNPTYERSPTPERVAAEQAVYDEGRKIHDEDKQDYEIEKLERAEHLDPTKAAWHKMEAELLERIIADFKLKIGTPQIYKCLDPADSKNIEIRKKFNIADPHVQEAQKSFPTIGRADSTSVSGTPDPRSAAALRKFALQRKDQRQTNAYLDGRRAVVRPRNRPPRTLYSRIQDFESDSEDERTASMTRGSDGPESRAISEAARSPAPFQVDDDGHLTPRHIKRQRTEQWAAESDDESVDLTSRKSLGRLLDRNLEDMTEAQLEKVLSSLKRSDPMRKKALEEIKQRRKTLHNDSLFRTQLKEKTSVIDIMVEDTDSVSNAAATPEPFEAITKAGKKKSTKTKRKTKKQIEEEAEAQVKAEVEKLDKFIEEFEETPDTPAVAAAEEDFMIQPRAEVEWGVSTTEPRRTVEDDNTIILDVDGWQHTVKDTEDLMLLRKALQDISIASLECSADVWSHQRKQFKSLNTGGLKGVCRETLEIPGYYVPNPTGSAKTEPNQKIKESEKSKYLPHRIKVRNLREKRQEEARNNRKGNDVAQVIVRQVAGASSRSNRAENRRVQNEVNSMGADNDTLLMNALKKRKKCVRFDRSAIHGWGLYCEENIQTNEMIIEYVGEKIRQRIADVREELYDLQGVGSSYLFRIDDDMVIDATKKGGIARFINHSCMPNCTAKIIKVDGTKRIVIYAMRDIQKDEELTYDYKFDREMNSDDRIPCLCGTVACKGFLN